MRLLNWDEFNLCVKTIADLCVQKDFSGVYGFPRGGLCLAVAISHALRIPLLPRPEPNSLILDDVYETGQTLNKIKEVPGVTAFVWLSKVEAEWWHAVEICEADEWLVFPWENLDFAEQEEKTFHLIRSKTLD